MNRPDITKSLSDLVRTRLKNTCNFWAEEVNLDYSTKRVDFVGFSARNGVFARVSEIEHGAFDFYEVKSSMNDFNSGHGKNWEGDRNYLVCERELADELYSKMLLPQNTEVLCPNKPRTALVTAYKDYQSSKRTKAASEILWNMICARSSNKIEVVK
ncbi:hypothetical protein [Lactovum miscens]|uniref:Uncharacterized protein n=1 Tax=Lactovum miscens TaxID=190387 RepID=A0A841C7L2_9LACT|nr:hypothetical protein [Lactovum miscens]MBB5887728.1 hypothetical protein [Lactovum miscens]